MSKQPFVIERSFKAPVTAVWQAISDAEQMKAWYFDMEGFMPEVGTAFTFTGCGTKGDKYVHLCRVLAVIPEKLISYSWAYDGFPGSSVVTIELEAEGTGTRLKLTHAGLETFGTDNPDFAPGSFASGWTQIIGTSLGAYLTAKH